jgi:hypothetical protein
MEPKDYEDLYRVGDSQLLRQMSIDNANMALNQAQRISGWDSSRILDYIKKEFESKKILTIQNFDSLSGATMEYKGNRWNVDYVEQTQTTYFFGLSKRTMAYPIEVRIGLSRVPMEAHDIEMYNLFNESYGGWEGVEKGIIKTPHRLMAKMIELTELPF